MALLKNIAVSPRFLWVDLVGSLGLTEVNFLGGFLVNLDQSRSWVGWVPVNLSGQFRFYNHVMIFIKGKIHLRPIH